MKKNIIFGAGAFGKVAYDELGAEKIDFFIDNNKSKQGKLFCGKPIISIEEAAEKKEDYHVVIASLYATSMLKDLEKYEITDYEVYVKKIHGFFETDELIVNPYKNAPGVQTEEEWNNSFRIELGKKGVFDEVERIYNEKNMFEHIEVETVNRCNGICSFCPVNKNIDPREHHVMTEELFKKIVLELEKLNYSGRFTTFSNNEPLLDERIIGFNKYAREHLANARMHLFTNGTLLTLDKFKELIELLDELVIDNYQQELKLIKPCEIIADYCENHPELKKKVTIVLRKPQEILTTRGGNAPNRKTMVTYDKERCILPFKQMIIRPDGKVSLCCNDAIGKFSLGDVNKESLTDIWYGPRFEMVRKSLYKGRENWGDCKYCDTFFTG